MIACMMFSFVCASAVGVIETDRGDLFAAGLCVACLGLSGAILQGTRPQA